MNLKRLIRFCILTSLFISCVPIGTKSVPNINSSVLPTQTLVSVQTTNEIPTALANEFRVVFSSGPNRDNCYQDTKSELWVAHYHEKPQLFLASADSSFYNPEYSPLGHWIAYVQSEPDYISDTQDLNKSKGKDTVWVVKPDGTNNKKISIEVRSTILNWSNGCQVVSAIERPLVWSPNEKYITFINTRLDNGFRFDYYIINVESSESRFLLTQERGSMPIWSLDSRQLAIVDEKNSIKVFDFNDPSHFTLKKLTLPENISSGFYWDFVHGTSTSLDTEGIFGVFYEGIKDVADPKFLSYWQVDLENDSWKFLMNLGLETKDYAVASGRDVLYLCDKKTGGEIKIIDVLSQLSERTINLEKEMYVGCSNLRELESGNLLYIASDLSSIELINVTSGQIETFVDNKILSSETLQYIYYFSVDTNEQ